MRRKAELRRIPWLLALLLAASPLAAGSRALRQLVAAERAFALDAAERGMREAFLAFLADDAVLFRPGPVEGRRWFLERPAPEGLLRWEPVHAEVARAGDLGYTTGPWEFRRDGPEPVTAHGHYASVWRRQAAGSWRVAIDIGTGHAAPPPAAWKGNLRGNPRRQATRRPSAAPRGPAPDAAALLEAERTFAALAERAGWAAAYREHASPQIRFQREGRFPVVGMRDLLDTLDPAERGIAATPEGAEVSRSDDLGYTYGRARGLAAAGPSGYLRVWVRATGGGPWRIALEVAVPLPAEE